MVILYFPISVWINRSLLGKKKQSRHNWIFSAINLSIWLFMNVHLVLWSITQYHPSFYCSNCSILGHEDPLKEALFACHVFQLCVNTPIFMALPVVLSALCSPSTSPVTNHFCKVTCNFVEKTWRPVQCIVTELSLFPTSSAVRDKTHIHAWVCVCKVYSFLLEKQICRQKEKQREKQC